MKLRFIISVVIILFFLLIFFYLFENILDITGNTVGIASVAVSNKVSIILTTASVNFGIIDPGMIDDTIDNVPFPFIIENTGNVKINVTVSRDVNSTALFSGTGGGDDSSSFQFMPGVAESNSYDTTCSPSNWTNVPGITSILAICKLDFPSSRDSAEIELKIEVPIDEIGGEKTEMLNFIAYQA